MKTHRYSFLVAIVITVLTTTSALAGGGACQFKSNGLPLLSQSPALADLLTSKFTLKDSGKMGPMDAPFDGGRLYTYMEFQASLVGKPENRYLVRIHFKRGQENPSEFAFASLEILPQKTDATEEERNKPVSEITEETRSQTTRG